MSVEFPRVISLLRKEAGQTQKQVAGDLGISQALLSHYEKGIRECGLAFLVKCSQYYGVSCDYLLGVSPVRNGATIREQDIPEPEAMGKENIFTGSLLPTLNKKLIANSLNIVYDYLSKSKSKEMVQGSSAYLMLAVYQVFRAIHSGNKENQDALFMIPGPVSTSYARAAMTILEQKIVATSMGEKIGGVIPVEDRDVFFISTESLNDEYPLFAPSLLNLIKNAEIEITKVAKEHLVR